MHKCCNAIQHRYLRTNWVLVHINEKIQGPLHLNSVCAQVLVQDKHFSCEETLLLKSMRKLVTQSPPPLIRVDGAYSRGTPSSLARTLAKPHDNILGSL